MPCFGARVHISSIITITQNTRGLVQYCKEFYLAFQLVFRAPVQYKGWP
jgi:hypothetical protein